jgi:hypothetical protein
MDIEEAKEVINQMNKIREEEERKYQEKVKQLKANMDPELGTFEVKSGKLVVSDPCYERGTWCHGILEGVKNGKWVAGVSHSDERGWGIRNAELLVQHEEVKRLIDLRWREATFEVGVDSGQAGIFCDSVYPQSKCGEYGDDSSFYGQCCNATLNTLHSADTVEGGVVSSSGFGDGGYVCEYAKNKQNEIVAVKVTFIGEEELCEDCECPLDDCECCAMCGAPCEDCDCDE